MKTEQRWKESFRTVQINKYFPPRIQRDFKNGLQIPSLPDINFQDGEGLFLYGPTASGKTILAAELMLQECKRLWLAGGKELEKGFEFVSTPQLLFDIKQTYSHTKAEESTGPAKTEEYLLRHYTNLYFLILDDFGVIAKQSEWVLNTMYLIINGRYEAGLPTIFTSNLNLEQIADLFDDRIASRIERMCTVLQKKPWDKVGGKTG